MAHKTALKSILAAVYGALNVAGFTALSTGGVTNYVVQSPTFPYTRIEGGTEQRFDTFGTPGKDALIEVHVFSQYHGDAEALDILSKAIELLHYVSLTISGHTTAMCQHESTEPAGSEDIGGVPTYHWLARFRVVVQES